MDLCEPAGMLLEQDHASPHERTIERLANRKNTKWTALVNRGECTQEGGSSPGFTEPFKQLEFSTSPD